MAGGLAAESFTADIFSGSILYPSGVIKGQRQRTSCLNKSHLA